MVGVSHVASRLHGECGSCRTREKDGAGHRWGRIGEVREKTAGKIDRVGVPFCRAALVTWSRGIEWVDQGRLTRRFRFWHPTPGTTMPEETIDPGLLEQTKNQIRKLVAEIADLAE